MRSNPLPFLRLPPFLQLPTRRFSQRRTAIIPAINRLGSAQWVLSRPLYRFSRFDLKHVSKGKRNQALRIQIRQWSPYANTGQYVVWGSEHALVWAWDADRLEADLGTQKLKPESTEVIPESLLHPPLVTGLRLVACLEGVEGQIWQDQRPVHSRWWADPPSAIEWINFQRDASLTPDQSDTIPALQTLKWLKQPWAKTTDLGLGGGESLPHESLLIRVVVALFAIFTIWYAFELIKIRQAAAQLRNQLADAGQSANPLVEARRKALEAMARIEMLQATNLYPTQLALLAEVAKNLPKDGSYLNEWDYQNGRLRITIASPNKLSSSALVKKLQDSGWFRNVQSGPANDPTTLTLNMDTSPQNEITLMPSNAIGQGGLDKMGNAVKPVNSIPKT